MHRYIFITGGVLSSLGKGIAAGGIAALLEAQGLSVSFLKLDPYLNLDPGTMNPYQHGEVFVTDDGSETDLDLGHYERFSHATLTKRNCTTAGKLYAHLLDKERKGLFLGQTVQTVPHFTDEIKEYIYQARNNADILIVEIGGTVGDIEGLPFCEAIRQIRVDSKNNRCIFVHVTYIPYIAAADEVKTKPTQHSVKALLSLGIQPDIIIGRSEKIVPEDAKKKIALFTNVDEHAIIAAPDLKNVYETPLLFHQQKLDTLLSSYLGIDYSKPDLSAWNAIVDSLYASRDVVTIALVGKYVGLRDAYKSVCEALIHAQIPNRVQVVIDWIDSEQVIPETVVDRLKRADGILVPGGFGDRGIEGKIEAIRYAREQKVPYLGICLGMQLAVVEFGRNALGLVRAHSTEFDASTPFPVIDLMREQHAKVGMGANMRLGAYECALKPGSRVSTAYGKNTISERHRHRYEFNTDFIEQYEERGFVITGYHKERNLPEVVEIPTHSFFVGCQFHPEFKSKPFEPHPLFVDFVKAACAHKNVAR